MKRAFAVVTVALAVSLTALAPTSAGEVPPPGQDPSHPGVFYDREGVAYYCIDTDEELGCLYRVEQAPDGSFTLYWVDNNGMKNSYRIAEADGWGRDYGRVQVTISQNDGYWQFNFSIDWRFVHEYNHADPNARGPGDPYPCCDDYGNCW